MRNCSRNYLVLNLSQCFPHLLRRSTVCTWYPSQLDIVRWTSWALSCEASHGWPRSSGSRKQSMSHMSLACAAQMCPWVIGGQSTFGGKGNAKASCSSCGAGDIYPGRCFFFWRFARAVIVEPNKEAHQ
eukprot:2353673-Amphidinium_carterae.1